MADRITLTYGLRLGLSGATLLAIFWLCCTHITRQGETRIVVRMGRPIHINDTPGLHLNLPWPIDTQVAIDMRGQVLETGHTEMLTRDKKNVVVMTYCLWHVDDPLRFFQAIGNTDEAAPAVIELLTNAAIGVMGRHDLSALTSTDPEQLQTDTIEAELLAAAVPVAAESYGVQIERVGIMRLSLPEQNTEAVFEQMRAERRQYAAKFTADGKKEAARIKSETVVAVSRIEAEAIEKAALIRGEADAEAARIYAEAHKLDPELYRFTRGLESIEKVVGRKTTLLLRTDSEPLSLLKGEP